MLRIARVTVGILLVSLLLVNIYVRDPNVRTVYSILLVTLLAVSILQIYYLTKARRVFEAQWKKEA